MTDWVASADEAWDSMECCQRCGGQVGATDPSDACLCETPTLWKSRKGRTAAGEAFPGYEALADAEWESMYDDVIQDLCLSALRIPDDKLTVELFKRLVRRAMQERDVLADGHEDFEDFNRIWSAMLQRIEREPVQHLRAVRQHLPTVLDDVRKQGGTAYAEGRTALARRELELRRAALNVDDDWNPL